MINSLDKLETEIRARQKLREHIQSDMRSFLALEAIADELTILRGFIQAQAGAPVTPLRRSPGEWPPSGGSN